jgi:hypothetical protein
MDLTSGLDPAREEILTDAPDDPLLREAVNMWIWDDEGRFGLPRVAVEAIGRRWGERAVQVNISLPGGRVLLGTCLGEAHPARDAAGKPVLFGAGPLDFTLVEPFSHWRVSYRGEARDTTVGEQLSGEIVARPTVPVEFEVEATMVVPPLYPGQMSAAARELLSGPEGSFVSTRYEQLFRAEGIFRAGGVEHPFTGGGLRIRRTGRRDSREMRGHVWQSALFPSGRGFGFMCFPDYDDGRPSFNEGYVFMDGAMIPARAVSASWMSTVEPIGGDVSAILETDEGTIEIGATTELSTFVRRVSELNDLFEMPFIGGADKLLYHQGIARYRWDGEEGYGMIERSWPFTEIITPGVN